MHAVATVENYGGCHGMLRALSNMTALLTIQYNLHASQQHGGKKLVCACLRIAPGVFVIFVGITFEQHVAKNKK